MTIISSQQNPSSWRRVGSLGFRDPSACGPRNQALDALRGFLVLAVVAVHMLQATTTPQHLGRRLLYLSGVQLLLGLSGYLMTPRTFDLSWMAVLRKYWTRLWLPYTVAFLGYGVVGQIPFLASRMARSLDIRTALTSYFFVAWQHFWYVPALMLSILLTKALGKRTRVLWAALLVAAFVAISLEYLHASLGPNLFIEYPFLSKIGELRYYQRYVYFLAGFLVANSTRRDQAPKLLPFAVVLLGVALALPEQPLLWASTKVIGNILLIASVLPLLEAATLPNNYMAVIGRISLPLYLWHYLPIMFLWPLVPTLPVGYYYTISVACMALLIGALLWLRGRSVVLDAALFGIRSTPGVTATDGDPV